MSGGIQVERAGQHTGAPLPLPEGIVQVPAAVILAFGALLALASLLVLFRVAHERGHR